jgi:hypothetical protein
MKKEKTNIPLNYLTVRTTKSRINKGLLAIPVSLIDFFPKEKSKIFVLYEDGSEKIKSFTPYNSSSRECRIGGMKEFYEKYSIYDNDEIVIQKIDDDKFKLLPEKMFEFRMLGYLSEFEKSSNDAEANQKIHDIAKLANITTNEMLKNAFVNLSNFDLPKRAVNERNKSKVNESVPLSMRKILLSLYEGKCQITQFTFLKRDGNPYFEIHHIDPKIGNHFKNLLVVSPNTHAQFTYSKTEQTFDNEGWLREVKFNNKSFSVFQIIDDLPKHFEKEVHL